MEKEEILVCITNHNGNENSIHLKENLSNYFDSIIIDSGSSKIHEEFDVQLGNVYYSGLFNESVRQCRLRNKKYLFFIASDVFFPDFKEIPGILSNLDPDVYLWTPSSRGQSFPHCKRHGDSIREIPFPEGFCFIVNIECCDLIYPVSLERNKFGYGIDLLLGYACIRIKKKKCVVDDRIEVYHKEGTGYSQNQALKDMYDWMINDFDQDVLNYTRLYSRSPGYKKILEYLKS